MSAACLSAFREKYPENQAVGCAGLSLGEFAALYGANVFSFAEGLKLVARRGELMDEACKENHGAMASVLGGSNELISEVCAESDIDVANFNCPGQTVISGTKEGVEKAVSLLKEKGCKKVIPLKVAGAYHSRLMKGASEKFANIIETVQINAPSLPVAQNFPGKTVESVADIRKNLVEQIAGSVKWENCVKEFISKGADSVIEFGPGNVLTGLMRRIDRNIQTYNIGTAEGLENFSA
jgi:[acyl-carrier-protein] S-malonyltransferase